MTDNMLMAIDKADPRPRKTLKQALECDDRLIATLYFVMDQEQSCRAIADELEENLSSFDVTVEPSGGAPINKSSVEKILAGLAIFNGSINAWKTLKKIKPVLDRVAERLRATVTPSPRAFPELIEEYLNDAHGRNNWLYDANECLIKEIGERWTLLFTEQKSGRKHYLVTDGMKVRKLRD